MLISKKTCSDCNKEKEIKDFHKSHMSKDGYRSKCRICVNKIRRLSALNKKKGEIPNYEIIGIQIPDNIVGAERLKEYHKIYRQLKKEKIKVSKRIEAENAKYDGIHHYGGKCSCCGESMIEFLTLEHLNGRDKSKKRRTGKLAWLEAKGIFGTCPHTWKEGDS